MPRKGASLWKSILEELPLCKVAPEGYVTASEFSKRAGVHEASVRAAIERGAIDKRFCVATTFKNSDRRKIWISWDMAGEEYARTSSADGRSLRGHKKQTAVAPTPVEENPDAEEVAVYDLPSAKYKAELLKIKKMEEELRKIKAETILVADAVGNMRSLGALLKAEFQRSIQAVAPKLVSARTPLECRTLLEDNYREILASIDRMIDDQS